MSSLFHRKQFVHFEVGLMSCGQVCLCFTLVSCAAKEKCECVA